MLVLGLLLLAMIALFLPRKHFGERDLRIAPRGFLFSSSLYFDDGEVGVQGSENYRGWRYEYSLDLLRLLCECIVVVALTSAVFIGLNNWKSAKVDGGKTKESRPISE